MSRAATPSTLWPVVWALLLAFGGLALTVTVMASERPFPAGVILGAFGSLVATLGLLWLATPRAASPGPATSDVAARSLLRPAGVLGLSLAAHFGVVVIAVAGVLPAQRFSAALLVTASFLALVVAAYRFCAKVGFFAAGEAEPRALSRRHGFWLVVLTSLLYLPMLGNFALLDPWETHYGEVAREMLARDDWISLWWAQDGFFFTKPILNFWAQGLSFKLFGVRFMPDQMISTALLGRVPQPEWACRLPVFWMTLLATYALYKGSARLIGRRAAFIGGLILLTCPYWFLLARQTMADMPYVAPLCVALALLLLAFHTDPEARVREYRVAFGKWTLRFDGYHLLFGLVLLCVLPQVAYLLSRNLTLHLGDPFGFRPHLDEFAQGSGGNNCGLPSNKRCAPLEPLHRLGQPALLALLWLGMAVGLLLWNRKERRSQRLLFLGAWFATALSVMAKGAPGLALPLVTAIGYPVITGRFRDLLRMKLPSLLLLTLCVALPWYVQMFMRHGMPFVQRLVLHDMVDRAFAHVHDTNTGDDTSFRYYIWQLGYGLFPWTGLCAGGLFWWARGKTDEGRPRAEFAIFTLVWFLAGFGMFTLTMTKFHHYVLPLVPPAAMLTGLLVSAYLPRGLFEQPRRSLVYLAVTLLAADALLFGVVCFFPNWKNWLQAANTVAPAAPWLGAGALLIGIVLLVVAARVGPQAEPLRSSRSREMALAVMAVAAGISVLLAGRDMVHEKVADVVGPIRVLHLVTYNYDRPWPETLNLSGPMAAFTVIAGLACFGLAIAAVRRHAAVLLCSVAFLWTIYCCNDYLVRIAPHWAQRDTMLSYYKHRKSAAEPLVAFQMNWKGENFYTGNRMATFVSSGAKFKSWLEKKRQAGTSTFFITTEHTRIKTLKKELGTVQSFDQLTDEKDNNKFFLAKVVFPPWKATPVKPADGDKEPEE